MKQFKKKICEDGIANCAGAGNIAGIGVPNPEKGESFGEPGRSKKALLGKRQIWVRAKPNG